MFLTNWLDFTKTMIPLALVASESIRARGIIVKEHLWELQQVLGILIHFLLVLRVFIRHRRSENLPLTMKNAIL